MANDVNDEELEGLSEEERAALEEDDESVAASEETDETDEPEPDEPEEGQVAAEQPADEEVEQVAAEDGQETEEELSETEGFTPRYHADPVENYQQQLDAITAEKRELRRQFNEGEVEFEEYEDKRDAIDDRVLSLREANLKATMAAEQTAQSSEQRWQWEQEQFFDKKENKAYASDPILNAALDTAIKSLANDPANEGKKMSWFLTEADRMTRERFKVGPDDAKQKPQSRKADMKGVPPTLARLPSAELAETGGADEFARFDGIKNGMDLETALAGMTPAEEKRYLHG